MSVDFSHYGGSMGNSSFSEIKKALGKLPNKPPAVEKFINGYGREEFSTAESKELYTFFKKHLDIPMLEIIVNDIKGSLQYDFGWWYC